MSQQLPETFTRAETCHTAECECVACGETLIFSTQATFGEIEKELLAHRCNPTALRVKKGH